VLLASVSVICGRSPHNSADYTVLDSVRNVYLKCGHAYNLVGLSSYMDHHAFANYKHISFSLMNTLVIVWDFSWFTYADTIPADSVRQPVLQV